MRSSIQWVRFSKVCPTKGGIFTDTIATFKNQTFPPEPAAVSATVLETMRNMKKETITVSFCGTFKSGKSSLINALLGVKLLPVRIA